ncbi:CpaF family protein [Bacillus cereus]|uniref:CpaF family protein n=1 Tax=Bacillus cereus group TaxID=86661 RepID=UPI0010BE73F9|nr:ATPase, T2SS/T4P/T4SS family [Bacillus cereus]TKH75768.1 CpaF family protein [Bacillus cereus]
MGAAVAIKEQEERLVTSVPNNIPPEEIMQILSKLKPKSINKINLGVTTYSSVLKDNKKYGKMTQVPIDVVNSLREYLIANHRNVLEQSFMNPKKRKELTDIISLYIKDNALNFPGISAGELINQLVDAIAGLGQIQPLIDDPAVTDVYINAINDVEIDKVDGRTYRTNVKFNSLEEAMEIVYKIINSTSQTLNTNKPLADAALGKLRVNIANEAVSYETGLTVAIRKPQTSIKVTKQTLIESGQASSEMMKAVKAFVEAGLNILVVGPTGTGKTQSMRVLSGDIPNGDRTFVLEDNPEMFLKSTYPEKRFVSWRCRQNDQGEFVVDYGRLLFNTLRQNPSRIIVGEARDKSALNMLKIFNSGHPGMSSIHANSAEEAVGRLIYMIEEGDTKLTYEAIGRLIASTIDIIIFQDKLRDRSRKWSEIIELVGFKDGEASFNTLFNFEVENVVKDKEEIVRIEGRHKQSGYLSKKTIKKIRNKAVDMSLIDNLISPEIQEGN